MCEFLSRIRTCCGCCSVGTGSKIVCWLTLLAFLSFAILLIISIKDLVQEDSPENVSGVVVHTVAGFICLLLAFCIILGVFLRKPEFLLIFAWAAGFCGVFGFAVAVCKLIINESSSTGNEIIKGSGIQVDVEKRLYQMIGFFIGSALSLYSALVVYSFYQELKETPPYQGGSNVSFLVNKAKPDQPPKPPRALKTPKVSKSKKANNMRPPNEQPAPMPMLPHWGYPVNHPPYPMMNQEALGERGWSSRLDSSYPMDPPRMSKPNNDGEIVQLDLKADEIHPMISSEHSTPPISTSRSPRIRFDGNSSQIIPNNDIRSSIERHENALRSSLDRPGSSHRSSLDRHGITPGFEAYGNTPRSSFERYGNSPSLGGQGSPHKASAGRNLHSITSSRMEHLERIGRTSKQPSKDEATVGVPGKNGDVGNAEGTVYRMSRDGSLRPVEDGTQHSVIENQPVGGSSREGQPSSGKKV